MSVLAPWKPAQIPLTDPALCTSLLQAASVCRSVRMAARNNKATQSKYDHLLKLLLIGDSGEFQTRARRGLSQQSAGSCIPCHVDVARCSCS